jgi:hypothetical protein
VKNLLKTGSKAPFQPSIIADGFNHPTKNRSFMHHAAKGTQAPRSTVRGRISTKI